MGEVGTFVQELDKAICQSVHQDLRTLLILIPISYCTTICIIVNPRVPDALPFSFVHTIIFFLGIRIVLPVRR